MHTVSDRNFGLLIAYVVPGCTALWGVSCFSSSVNTWLSGTAVNGPTVGGFLYVTLAAVAAGMTVSTVRWALIDSLHHVTGIKRPDWNFLTLQQHFDAYDRLESNHYRFYQFYGGMVIALLFTWGCWRIGTGVLQMPTLVDLAFLGLSGIFLAGSRDTLAKYYGRVSHLIGLDDDREGKASPGSDSR